MAQKEYDSLALKNTKVGDMVIYNNEYILFHSPPYADRKTDFWKLLVENSFVPKEDVNSKTSVPYSRKNLEKSFVYAMDNMDLERLEGKSLPTMYKALFNNNLALDTMSDLKAMGAGRGSLTVQYEEGEIVFGATSGYEGNEAYTLYKGGFPDMCKEAVERLEQRYEQTKELTETAKIFHKSDVDIPKSNKVADKGEQK